MSNAEKAASSSALLWIMTGSIMNPVAAPLLSTRCKNGFEKGSGTLASAAMRRAAGISSWTTSTNLPASSAPMAAMPVTLPPGWARLATGPVSTGLPHQCHHDRGLMSCLPSGESCRREPGYDQFHLEPHQLLSQRGKPACLPRVRSKFVSNVSSLDVTELAHILLKSRQKRSEAGDPTTRTPMVGIFGCCAAANDARALAAPTNAMSSRRLMVLQRLASTRL